MSACFKAGIGGALPRLYRVRWRRGPLLLQITRRVALAVVSARAYRCLKGGSPRTASKNWPPGAPCGATGYRVSTLRKQLNLLPYTRRVVAVDGMRLLALTGERR